MAGYLIPTIIIGATLALSWPLGRYMRWAMDPVDAGPRRSRYEAVCSALLGSGATRQSGAHALCSRPRAL